MERVVDFLLDSAARNGLRPRSASTGNGLMPALRVNTLSTASAFDWKASFPHGPGDLLKHQQLSIPPNTR
jgi:hypothetical protein